MKNMSILLTATLVAASLVVPVNAKSKSLYVLTRMTTQQGSSHRDLRLSYNKKGLLTKTVFTQPDESSESSDSHSSTSTTIYSYKGTRLMKVSWSSDHASETDDYRYSKNKIVITMHSGDETFTDTCLLKGNKIVKTFSSEHTTQTYTYNKKGQFVKRFDKFGTIQDGYKYDKKGYAYCFNGNDMDISGHFTLKYTYKHDLPSTVKQYHGKKLRAIYHFYYKKMKVSAYSSAKDQQYSFLHKDDPKADFLYNMSWMTD